MTELKPSDILNLRVKYFQENDVELLYYLYSEKSELRRVFTTLESYSDQFSKILEMTTHAGIKIVKESIKGKLAEVTYIEYFTENNEIIQYYCKAHFIDTDGEWKILREKKERVVQDKS